MTRTAVEQFLYLTDNAFEVVGTAADEAHSLLSNLRSVTDDDWPWLPPGGGRRIFDIVRHVGGASSSTITMPSAMAGWAGPGRESSDK